MNLQAVQRKEETVEPGLVRFSAVIDLHDCPPVAGSDPRLHLTLQVGTGGAGGGAGVGSTTGRSFFTAGFVFDTGFFEGFAFTADFFVLTAFLVAMSKLYLKEETNPSQDKFVRFRPEKSRIRGKFLSDDEKGIEI